MVKKIIALVGGFAGIAVIVTIVLTIIPIYQTERDNQEDSLINATIVALQAKQAIALEELVTLQASNIDSGPAATAINNQIIVLLETIQVLESAVKTNESSTPRPPTSILPTAIPIQPTSLPPTSIPTQQPIDNTPIPVPTRTPQKITTEVTGGSTKKSYSQALESGEVLVGHGDKLEIYNNTYTSCIVYLITGPGTFSFNVESGLWDKWINVTPNSYKMLLDEQEDVMSNTYHCTPVKVIQCNQSSCSQTQ